MDAREHSSLRTLVAGAVVLAIAPPGCNGILGNEYPTHAVPDASLQDATELTDGAMADAGFDAPADAGFDAPADAGFDAPADASRIEAASPDAGQPTSDASPCAADLRADNNNCGWCGHSCLGAACDAGLCTPTAVVGPRSYLQGLYAMVVDADEVYFTEWCGGTQVYKAKAPMGTPVPVASGGDCGSGLVKDGDTLFYGDVLPGFRANLMSASADGGTPVMLATAASDSLTPVGVDADNVYYVVATGDLGVYRVARTGGTPVGLYLGAVDVAAALGPYIYFTSSSSGQVFAVPTVGSTGATALYTLGQPLGITADAKNVYWMDQGNGVVYRGDRSGTSYSAMTPPIGYKTSQLVIDDTSVYFFGPNSEQVMGVNKDGTNLRVYANGSTAGADSMAVDAQYVYWAEGVAAPASIWRVPK